MTTDNPFREREPANPYASPTALPEVAIDVGVAGELTPASQGLRFANLLLDNIVLFVASNAIGFLYGMAYALSRSNPGLAITPQEELFINVTGTFVGWGVSWCYFTFFEALFQRSPAKFITGTKVVRADGGVPTFGQVAGRSLARFIPLEAFSFLGGKGFPVGWHDSLTGTRVIKVNRV